MREYPKKNTHEVKRQQIDIADKNGKELASTAIQKC